MRRSADDNVTEQVKAFLRHGHSRLAFCLAFQSGLTRWAIVAAMLLGAYKINASALLSSIFK